MKSVKQKKGAAGWTLGSDMAFEWANVSRLKPPTYKERLQSLRRGAGFAPRAAREVDAENQNLDGHGG